MKLNKAFFAVSFASRLALYAAGDVRLVPVVARPVSQSIELPGEIQPYQVVSINAKLRSYVEQVLVDRGSVVKQGQILIELSAPEMNAQIAEARSKVQGAEAERIEAESHLTAVESTFERMKKAAETPGAIAGNELVLARKQVDSARALMQSKREAQTAAESVFRAQKDLESYLHIRAPFSGVISDRLVHPGALVGPGSDTALLILQEVARLRLVVPLPEEDVGTIARGREVSFHVPSAPGRSYRGTTSRVAHVLDPKTRTMAVEVDVANRDGSLSPGMFPLVTWKVQGRGSSLLVPQTAVVTTSERIFVVRSAGGKAEWVNIVKGVSEGDSVEVRGDLHAGDKVVARASDEIRPGTILE